MSPETLRLFVDLFLLACRAIGCALAALAVGFLLGRLWRRSAPRLNAFWCGRHGYVPLPSLDRLPRDRR